jgi:Protein of unknown function (DUF3108)
MASRTSGWGRSLLAPFVASLAAIAMGISAPAFAQGWPASVRALYDVNFNGFNIGSLEFRSEAEQQSYTLLTNTRLSILLGAFTFDGETRSFGMLVNQAPKPAAFTFDFRSNLRAGSTKIGFSDGSVTNVTNLPPAAANPNVVPLRQQDLKGVLDPLSAILVVSRPNASPCDRRVPIFDGRERFDLIFTYKGEMKVSEQKPSGQPDVAFVCRVKYLPITGHKVDPETKFMANSDSIEVVLRPVPSANMLVPYRINIPTLAGYASIVSKRIEIATPGKAQIALTH